jgi:hypothetical protein
MGDYSGWGMKRINDRMNGQLSTVNGQWGNGRLWGEVCGETAVCCVCWVGRTAVAKYQAVVLRRDEVMAVG